MWYILLMMVIVCNLFSNYFYLVNYLILKFKTTMKILKFKFQVYAFLGCLYTNIYVTLYDGTAGWVAGRYYSK